MLPYLIALSGWIIFFFFITYGYHGYGPTFFVHLHSTEDLPHFYFHLAAFLAPLLSSTLAYLVTERMKILTGLKESEAKYFDLYQNSPDGFHSIGQDGTILEVNNTWLKMLGYERDEIIGRNITEILTEEGLEVFKNKNLELMRKGFVENIEVDFIRKDGTILPVVVNAQAVYDSHGKYLCSKTAVRDNTLKKGYEKILKRSASEWRETFDSMPYGVILLDAGFNIARANNYIAQISGIPIKDLIGRKCYEVIHETERPITGCPLHKASKTGNIEEFEFHEKRLSKYFKTITSPVFDEDDIVIAYVHSLIDITDMKNKEMELVKSRDAFFNMLKDSTEDYRELKDIQNNLILAFANAIDAKSPWTKGHSERVTSYAVSIAKEMEISEDNVMLLKTASLLHDIGKIGTYDDILNKPDKLTDEEFRMMKMHPAKGAEILKPIKQFADILSIVRGHHERIDGRGYSDGLKGDEIPLLARILHVADSFDAMTADRPYRQSPGKEYAISELKRCSGTQFDPEVVKAFLNIL